MQRLLSRDIFADPDEYAGRPVAVAGWVHRRRALAQVTFVVLRDRAGLVQIVVKDPSRNAGRAAEFARYPAGHAEGYGDAFRTILRDAYLAMEGRPHGSFPTFADGHRGMQVLEATLRSAMDGGWVRVGS